MNTILVLFFLLLVVFATELSYAQMPPSQERVLPPFERMPPHVQEKIPPHAQGNFQSMTNFGTDVFDFVKNSLSQFKQQRQETIDTIKQCRENLKNSPPETKDQTRQDCRTQLDEIKRSYKEIRNTFRDAFHEFHDDMKVLIDDAKGKHISDSQRQNAFFKINERATQKINLEPLQKRIKDNLETTDKENSVDQTKDSNLEKYDDDNSDSSQSLWNSELDIVKDGEFLIIRSNDIPLHPVGDFPNEHNPNRIQEQNFEFKIPLNPSLTGETIQPPMGPIGITLNGVVFFNPYTAEMGDAVLQEIFDDCSGHPTMNGVYHYHQLSNCFEDNTVGHSKMFGYAFDGFAVYGFNGADGQPPSDLDACGGHYDEERGYHYHATKEFPYLIGCYSGYPEPSNFLRR